MSVDDMNVPSESTRVTRWASISTTLIVPSVAGKSFSIPVNSPGPRPLRPNVRSGAPESAKARMRGSSRSATHTTQDGVTTTSAISANYAAPLHSAHPITAIRSSFGVP